MNDYEDIERENFQAITDREIYEENQLGEDTEPEDLYPAELDIITSVRQALQSGATFAAIGEAIIKGYQDAHADPFKIEQLADHLLDRSVELQNQ